MSASGEPRPAAVPPVVLASSSPRRLELLRRVGIEPEVFAVPIDETPGPGEVAVDLAHRLARSKAEAAWTRAIDDDHPLWARRPGPLLIAADTVIEIDGLALGKPTGHDDAVRMLRLLSGRRHRALTGVAVMVGGAPNPSNPNPSAPDDVEPELRTAVEVTLVDMVELDDADIAWYLATGEPMGKAGAYTIQGLSSWMVKHLEGSYHNVVGLPVAQLDEMTRQLGWPLRALASEAGAMAA